MHFLVLSLVTVRLAMESSHALPRAPVVILGQETPRPRFSLSSACYAYGGAWRSKAGKLVHFTGFPIEQDLVPPCVKKAL